MAHVFVGIGSNVQPEENIARCRELLKEQWPAVEFSPLYCSAPREYEEQDRFLNAVATFETSLSPSEVAAILQRIEATLKKNPPFTFGPRTIDLDLLLYGNEVIEEEHLVVPHPRMHERQFVLEPLCTLLDPKTLHPVLQQPWAELLAGVQDQDCSLCHEKAETAG